MAGKRVSEVWCGNKKKKSQFEDKVDFEVETTNTRQNRFPLGWQRWSGQYGGGYGVLVLLFAPSTSPRASTVQHKFRGRRSRGAGWQSSSRASS
jgi:hypothetical protein